MGVKDDARKLGADGIRDLFDFISDWLSIGFRFVVFFLIMVHVLGMDHSQALEVAALIAFADAGRSFQSHAKRVRSDIKTIVSKDGSVEQDVHVEEG